MQHRVSNGMTPLPSLQAFATAPRTAPATARGSPPIREAITPERAAHPEVAQKSPRTAAGKAQVSAARRQGSGGGSKGIRLEDSPAPPADKRRRQAKPSAKVSPVQTCFEDTFEESDDSTESYDGPFPGPSTAAAASSTTGDAVSTAR